MSKNNNDKWYYYTNQDVIIERLLCVIRGFHSPYNRIKALWLTRLLSCRNTRDRNSLAFAGGSTGAEVRAVTAWVPSLQHQEKYQSQSGDTNNVNNVFYGFGHYSFKSMNVWLKKNKLISISHRSLAVEAGMAMTVFYGFGRYFLKSVNLLAEKTPYSHQPPISCCRGRYGNDIYVYRNAICWLKWICRLSNT